MRRDCEERPTSTEVCEGRWLVIFFLIQIIKNKPSIQVFFPNKSLLMGGLLDMTIVSLSMLEFNKLSCLLG